MPKIKYSYKTNFQYLHFFAPKAKIKPSFTIEVILINNQINKGINAHKITKKVEYFSDSHIFLLMGVS